MGVPWEPARAGRCAASSPSWSSSSCACPPGPQNALERRKVQRELSRSVENRTGNVEPVIPALEVLPELRRATRLGAVHPVVAVFTASRPQIDSAVVHPKPMQSNDVLAVIAPGLEALNFTVETGKQKAGKLPRPVFFDSWRSLRGASFAARLVTSGSPVMGPPAQRGRRA